MAQLDMLSVHVPKCAGTSFFKALETAYGAKAIHTDYADQPLNPAAPMNLDPDGVFERWQRHDWRELKGARVVHGHYHIHKYRNVPARLRITFLRDPLDRLVSHYFFWKRMPAHNHALHSYMLEHKLSLDAFARLPFMRRFYTGVFFRGVDLAEFDFVGFHEQARADVERLGALAGLKLSLPVSNTNPDASYGQEVAELKADAARMARIRDLLCEDTAFYEKAQEKYRAA